MSFSSFFVSYHFNLQFFLLFSYVCQLINCLFLAQTNLHITILYLQGIIKTESIVMLFHGCIAKFLNSFAYFSFVDLYAFAKINFCFYTKFKFLYLYSLPLNDIVNDSLEAIVVFLSIISLLLGFLSRYGVDYTI